MLGLAVLGTVALAGGACYLLLLKGRRDMCAPAKLSPQAQTRLEAADRAATNAR